MALINCPKCNTEISDSAPQCLKCGDPIKSKKGGFLQTLKKNISSLIVIVGVIVALLILFRGGLL